MDVAVGFDGGLVGDGWCGSFQVGKGDDNS